MASSGQSNKPCFCKFSWSEINPNAGNVATPRTIQTALTQVQPYVAICSAPSVYSTEIISGTQIQIKVVAGNTNPDTGSFSMNPYLFTVSPTTVTGNFQDAEGRVFNNIVHYSCYNNFQRGLTIQSQAIPGSNNITMASTNFISATSFCLTASGGAGGGAGCSGVGPAANSSQAYYFNLYVRDSEKGNINLFNSAFTCPLVQEALLSTGSTSSTIGTTGQFWPGDTTFALSLGATADFSVGVQANTTLSGGKSDPVTQPTQCYATNGGNANANAAGSIMSTCLGFAASPASDGTCNYIKTAAGQILQTYRLRRFVALYPPLYDTSGAPLAQAQPIDSIYVLDRPVQASASSNPVKPYTMLGPKPCPFAFFDANHVTATRVNPYANSSSFTDSALPLGYRATNDTRWKTGDGTINWSQSWTKAGIPDNNGGTNIDALEFPNYDTSTGTGSYSGPISCSAAIPFLSADQTRFKIATVNKYRSLVKFNHLFIRPFKPWTPHYVEDTNFLACAPQANPFQDPPLHLMPSSSSAGSGQAYAWCAESYPTQNPNITIIDPPVTGPSSATIQYPLSDTNSLGQPRGGLVSPYTSHISTFAGAPPSGPLNVCTATNITIPTASYTYPGTMGVGANWGFAKHSNVTHWGNFPASGTTGNASLTCDRTVIPSSNVTWGNFPLLAPAKDVEAALATDASYNCTVTYDNNSGKAYSLLTPSGGCCTLRATTSHSGGTALTSTGGGTHVEPSQAVCTPPAF
jgi:hypothetical protein